jgi:tRNA nucleotidyltransferase (CCA-adding enzyme)
VIEGYKFDIVPCFRARNEGRIRSSTDRTPLHTKWLKRRLNRKGDEVRLLKQFLRIIEVYGAEIKIGGFSGYLCELLVIKHRSFMGLIEAASGWGEKVVISFNDETREFNDPLVVYDPVDSSRNVASALREDSYNRFISAAKAFRAKPSIRFFTVDETPVDVDELVEKIGERSLVFVVIEESKAEVPDTLWGQLRRSVGALEKQLRIQGFDVIKSTVWSNEKTRHIFGYMLVSSHRTKMDKHYGPPVHLEKDVEKFLSIYTDNPRVVSGPDIETNRWFVVLFREHTLVKETVDKLLVDGGARIGVSSRIAVRILQHHRVLMGKSIGPYLTEGFERHLAKFIRGRPFWVE